jgi:hypothetical protein
VYQASPLPIHADRHGNPATPSEAGKIVSLLVSPHGDNTLLTTNGGDEASAAGGPPPPPLFPLTLVVIPSHDPNVTFSFTFLH